MAVIMWRAITGLIILCASLIHAAVPVPNGTVAADLLSPDYYKDTCPQLYHTLSGVILTAVKTDIRIAASLLKLHFLDCFVQGCDGSILLVETAKIRSEQRASHNMHTVRGLNVVYDIKRAVEAVCPATVSCADILALSAQVASVVGGGPTWQVPLGRRDSLTANKFLANQNIPGVAFTVDYLKNSFAAQGLTTTDLVALSGAHTIGRAHCRTFMDRLYDFSGNPDPSMDSTYSDSLRALCPRDGSGANYETYLDFSSPDIFDNGYYMGLQVNQGLLHTDQELYSSTNADTAMLVSNFSSDQKLFFDQFVESMIKMSRIGVLTGSDGEIRHQCDFVNVGIRFPFSYFWLFWTVLVTYICITLC
ncbi:peroxidase A2-like [Lotus japonicus]|uniref:peroxidase A2-like n=1 Tax=Lotus japonicus TaxID=34305 RepID=UPI00258632ED|nr:peroxidase A2-like [Lotus japonicus]